ncbi:leginsulin related MtN11/16/17 family [Medicago truncatula]|uniref:Leginsulin related MtN11/16/17 family n=1 Tax=Medicago truncatula TaxID=3880 RepID=A0A072UE67_MEDTR|nr:leginsulin related MtN11/16/17 family [Medicago truncatula]
MTYVKLVTLAVFMLTTFLIVQTKNVEAGKCPSAGMVCSPFNPNQCGNVIQCRCIPGFVIEAGICGDNFT